MFSIATISSVVTSCTYVYVAILSEEIDTVYGRVMNNRQAIGCSTNHCVQQQQEQQATIMLFIKLFILG